ncbi:MAG: flagellar biosynthesis protein FlhA [Gammaproteobacteria bacterium]|nr:flagellar biosynthesis protein FlhA [Gammaproteobacteria bacterium]MDH5693326.1 flagellar biosynthesis protein FlhA [Gammaproteobacteria bacterium]
MNQALQIIKDFVKNGLGVPIVVMMLLGMIVLPLPPFMLDAFFTFSISLALVVLLASVYVQRPLDFSVFPTILLLATLIRLALNIASTRVVLLEGHTGTGAAGQVIESFGEFVIGGNYAVGLVVFAILVIINFVVVTKGAGRISEVSARFTLDALPGKQMAIDADLNTGLITQEQAQARRQEIVQEADFYGSMDGASKFVRGDAIAGILILFINIIGGFAIGTIQHELSFADAARNYTLLTIGDGLVAQIPSLLLSTAAAIVVTRVSAAENMGQQVLSQLFDNPRTLVITAVVMGIIGLIPGMPNTAFLTLAAIAGLGAYYMMKKREEDQRIKDTPPPPEPEKPKELGWDDISAVDLIGLEVGYRLIPLVDKSQGGELMARIKGVRKKLTQEFGFLIPVVHIRDNLELNPGAYRITLHGVPIGEAEIYADRHLAINPGQVFGNIHGIPGKDPAFGLEAIWIEQGQRDHAQTLGYTVVDPSTVIATHLSQILQTHIHELIGREEAQELLDKLVIKTPKLVEGLVPETLPLTSILKVLQNLLSEGIPIRDMRTIVQALADEAQETKDIAALTAAVRIGLSRSIVQQINGLDEELPVITLEPSLEHLLLQSIQVPGEAGGAGIEPGLAERILDSLTNAAGKQEMAGQPAVLLVAPAIRQMMSRFARRSLSSLHVLSYNEIPDNKQIRLVATVGQHEKVGAPLAESV